MAIDNIRLPVEIEQGAPGGPRFKTSIQEAMSGIEQRIAEWDHPRVEYDVGYAVRGKALLAEVIKLWRARQGPAYPFRFKDWTDFEATDVDIGTGDGSTAAFQLVKTYSDTIVEVTRTIQLPIEGTLAIEVAGSPQTETTHYTVNYATGVVTFTGGNIPTTGQGITATFEFDVPVRFKDDVLNVSMTMEDYGDIPSIPLIEVLNE